SPTQTEDPCTNRTPVITREEATGIAFLVGVPPSTDLNDPWQVRYLPAPRTYNVSGSNPLSGVNVTIGAQTYTAADSCVWVISHTPATTQTTAAFIEDVLTENAARFALTLP